jgi:hypothetical protein
LTTRALGIIINKSPILSRFHPMRRSVLAEVREQQLSPRVKLAARLYATGVVKTKKEAALAAGLSKDVLYQLRHEPKVNDLIRKVDQELEANIISTADVLKILGRKAIMVTADIMTSDTVKDDVRLKAAQDLADRSPETSKTLKIQAESSLTISDEAADLIRAAMMESARARAQFPSAASGNFVTATDEATREGLELVKDSVSALPSGEEDANS